MLASDATHLYSHIEDGKVFPITYNIGEVLEGYDTIKRLAPSAATTSCRVTTRRCCTAIRLRKAGMEGWIVRLDADPKGAA